MVFRKETRVASQGQEEPHSGLTVRVTRVMRIIKHFESIEDTSNSYIKRFELFVGCNGIDDKPYRTIATIKKICL